MDAGSSSEDAPAPADRPTPWAGEYSPEDFAELAALLAEIGDDLASDRAVAGSPGANGASLLFHCDVLAFAHLLASQGPLRAGLHPESENGLETDLNTAAPDLDRLRRLTLEKAAEVVSATALQIAAPTFVSPAPPPLTRGSWEINFPRLPAEHLLNPADLRWTIALRRRDVSGADDVRAILRLRVAQSPEGRPLFLPLPSECLILEGYGAGRRWAVWQFDRTRWRRGEPPWRQSSSECVSEIASKIPGEAVGEAGVAAKSARELTHVMTELVMAESDASRNCSQCHGEGASPPSAPLQTSERSAQIERAKEIFALFRRRFR